MIFTVKETRLLNSLQLLSCSTFLTNFQKSLGVSTVVLKSFAAIFESKENELFEKGAEETRGRGVTRGAEYIET